MAAPTYADLVDNLEAELDLAEETFISAAELLNYFNEGVKVVEAEIHTLYEDYFLTSAFLSLVSGTQSYSLPSDIYLQKIRGLVYSDGGSNNYKVRKIRRQEDIPFIETSDDYMFQIENSSASGNKIVLYPTSRETNSTNLKVWYLRQAKQFATDTDVCDIPEFTGVLIQYVRWKCLAKELHPEADKHLAVYDQMRKQMVETLTNRIPDEDTRMDVDFDFYRDFDSSQWYGR